MALLFEDAAKAKDAIMVSQQKEIQKLYDDWADDVLDKAIFYSHKTNASAAVSERYYKELFKQMNAQTNQIGKEVQGLVTSNMYTIADSVVASNVKWLKEFGFSEDGLNAAFSYIPNDVVQRLITGQIYQGGWNLSSAIWSDNQQTQRDVYQIMARGLAEQKSIYEIAKDLESYVRPSAKLPWNPVLAMKNTKTGQIEYKRIYKKQVDYNAQRLARTLAQHSYQQSFIAATEKNPFITEYIWHSNGSRVCPLCKTRDGVTFKKTELPMDHPNGMCIMEPVVAENMVDQLADWFNSPDGTYPEIDAFAGNFGYEAQKVGTLDDYIAKYGKSTKSHSAWYNSLTPIQKAEAKLLKEQSGLSWPQWYDQNIYSGSGSSIVKKAAKSKADDAIIAFKNKYSEAEFKALADKAYYGNYSAKSVVEEFLKVNGISPSDFAKYQDSFGDFDPDKYHSIIKSFYSANFKPAKAASSVTKIVANADNALDTASWFNKIKDQDEKYMLSLEKDSMKLIGEAGRAGITRYSGSSYEEMNAYLRYLQAGFSESEAVSMSHIAPSQLKSVKDAIAGLNNAKLTEDLVLRRGTDLGDLAGAFMSGDFGTNKMSLYGKSAEELNNMFAGAVGNYGSFTSTSSIWDKGFSGPVEVVIYAPKGSSASSIMSISSFGTSEGETLLNAGTTVKCLKVEDSDGHMGSKIRVFLEVIPK